MKPHIKNLGIPNLDIKNNGIEIQVDKNQGGQMGDLYVTKKGLVWCKGRTKKENGIRITWEKFAQEMEASASKSVKAKGSRARPR